MRRQPRENRASAQDQNVASSSRQYTRIMAKLAKTSIAPEKTGVTRKPACR
jgi:hypothetical protein